MEWGQPPLYAEVNRVTRELDMSEIENLGPFINILFWVLNAGEDKRSETDKIPSGKMRGGVEFNYAGCFMVWRGCAMDPDWVDPWEEKSITKEMVHLPCNTSTSRNMKTALKFAFDNIKPG